MYMYKFVKCCAICLEFQVPDRISPVFNSDLYITDNQDACLVRATQDDKDYVSGLEEAHNEREGAEKAR